MSKPVYLTHEDKTLTLSEWSRLKGKASRTIMQRINLLGWTVAEALDTPVNTAFRRGGRPVTGGVRACPKLKRHTSGRAFVRWKSRGKAHERYFGAWGAATTQAAYRTFAQEWAAGTVDTPTETDGIGVGELVALWVKHVAREYVKDGEPTSEYPQCVSASRMVLNHCAGRLAAGFTPADLRAIRSAWITRGLARSTCNAYTVRVVRMFGWAVGQSLIPPAVHLALKQVETLKAGRTAAHDPDPRQAATDAQIAATLPHLSPRAARRAKLAAMVTLQRLTGMRPGEVCALKVADLDRTADVWLYSVGKANKNRHRGKPQRYYLGPRAVGALTPYLEGADPAQPVFALSARDYRQAIRVACIRAGVTVWTPHQLRHALATEVAERFRSLDHAAAAIGDSNAVAQAVYVHLDPRERAKIEVARAMG